MIAAEMGTGEFVFYLLVGLGIIALAVIWILFPIMVWMKLNELLEAQLRIHRPFRQRTPCGMKYPCGRVEQYDVLVTCLGSSYLATTLPRSFTLLGVSAQ
jgi:hypothetical protein